MSCLGLLVTKARDARPQLEVDEAAFLRWLSEAAVEVNDATLENAGDLLLSFLCASASAPALAVLEREVIARLDSRSAVETDDIRQETRTALLVPREGAPQRIALFRGRSSLLTWVRVIARRRRPTPTNVRRAEASEEASAVLDPEELLAAQQDDAAFRVALQRAAQDLEPLERSLLVAHFLDGQTLDQLARERGLGRATVTRRLREACAVLRLRLQKTGATAVGTKAPQAASLMRLLAAAPDDDDDDTST